MTLLDQAEGVEWEVLPKNGKEIRAEDVRGYDALMVFGGTVTTATLKKVERLAVVARFGVGYDTRRRGRLYKEWGSSHHNPRWRAQIDGRPHTSPSCWR